MNQFNRSMFISFIICFGLFAEDFNVWLHHTATAGNVRISNWRTDGTGYPLYLSNNAYPNEGASALAWLSGDVDGDTKTDIIQPWDNNGGLAMTVYKSNGSSYTTTWSGNMGQGAGALTWLTGYVNGDNKIDIIQPWNNNGNLSILVYYSNGTGYTTGWGGNMGQSSSAIAWLKADINGDAHTDLIQLQDISGSLRIITYISNGTGFNTSSIANTGQTSSALAWLVGDVNGDSRADIIKVRNYNGVLALTVYTSDGTGYSCSWISNNMGQGSGALTWMVGDVNNDGRTDIIQPWDNNGQLCMLVYTSDGTGYSCTWGNNMQEGSGAVAWLVGDINIDGKTDIIHLYRYNNFDSLGCIVYSSNGTGFSKTWGGAKINNESKAMVFLAGDVNVDGRTDIIQIRTNVNFQSIFTEMQNIVGAKDNSDDCACGASFNWRNFALTNYTDGVVTTAAELDNLMTIPSIGQRLYEGNAIVVPEIGYCDGPNPNCWGCGNSFWNVFVVRNLENESHNRRAQVWVHEYGHNNGLSHRNQTWDTNGDGTEDFRTIMHQLNNNKNLIINSSECNDINND